MAPGQCPQQAIDCAPCRVNSNCRIIWCQQQLQAALGYCRWAQGAVTCILLDDCAENLHTLQRSLTINKGITD